MEQQQALDILKTGENVFLTGSAGTGKTYVLNQYIEYLRERGVPLAITASTGIAATHIDGQTIHSWSGIGIRDELAPHQLTKLMSKQKIHDQLKKVKVLIIDEISMLSRRLIECIDLVLRHARVSMEPFGGVQIIFCGDFFQLPPIGRDSSEWSKEKFAFMSPAWVGAHLHICYLEKQYRQGDDQLLGVLQDIRNREVTPQTKSLLDEKVSGLSDDSGVVSARLFTHNLDVDRVNMQELKKIKGKQHEFEAIFSGKKPLVEALHKSVLAPDILHLKKWARVMFVKNNYEQWYLNGTTGVVKGFSKKDGYPIIETDSEDVITAMPVDWHIDDDSGKVLASCTQIPLRLAWAITVHKSQGMTLDRAEIDLSKTFEAGQGYVALSRVKTWDGLQLLGYNEQSLEVDSLVYQADRRFKELSKEAEDFLKCISNTKEVQDAFVTNSGGTLDVEEIKQNKQKQSEPKRYKKEEKVSTYEQTKKLLLEKKPIEEIANVRQLSQDTIVSHIVKLYKEDPFIDIDHIRPSDKNISLVKEAIDACMQDTRKDDFDSDGNLKLGLIHRALKQKLQYPEIRLARLFIYTKNPTK